MFIRHLILFNPVQFIASFAIKTLVRRFNLPTAVFNLITVLYNTSYNLIGTTGIFPILRFLLDLRRFLANNPRLPTLQFSLKKFLIQRHSPFIIQTILPQIIPSLRDCLTMGTRSKKMRGFLFVFDFFILGFFSTMLKPIFKYVVKFSGGLLLSAIGVIWSESLSSLVYLKDLALLIINYFEEFTDLRIPFPTFENPFTEIDTPIEVDTIDPSEYQKTGSFFTIFELVVLGLAGVIGVIALTDHFAHETVQNIPVINTVADSINVTGHIIKEMWHSISSYFSSMKPGGSLSLPDAGTAIARASSNDSTITVTPASVRYMMNPTITPPPTSADTVLQTFDNFT